MIGDEFELKSNEDFPNLEMPSEDGTTFRENAIKKALSAALQSGLPTLADDSGLVVDALGGEPGVYSARYGGYQSWDDESRYKLLLSKLDGVNSAARSARFVCDVAFAVPEGIISITEGICEGSIGRKPVGENGFGYDPVFIPKGSAITYAQLPDSDKDMISHRFRALVKLLPEISKYFKG
jgi:XTP/dITP diphosphohydrolase